MWWVSNFLVARPQARLYIEGMQPHQPHHEALIEAIKIAGSQAALAKKLGKKQGHVWFWLNQAKKLTPTIAIKIEHATGVSRDRLCPELDPEYLP